jgi:hypothetical protein
MHLDVRVAFERPSLLFDRDPNAFPDTGSRETREVMMGDIVRTPCAAAELSLEVQSAAAIERIEIRNGTEVVALLRPFSAAELGPRVRVIWSGAEYRGRGRQTSWIGRARFAGCAIQRIAKINAWNHERLLEQRGRDTVEWDAITTGNFGGFDAWLEEGEGARLELRSNHGDLDVDLGELGMEDVVREAGGLERRLRVFRLPERNPVREMRERVRIPLRPAGDNPLWVCVTTEDGFQAWSSPVFAFN